MCGEGLILVGACGYVLSRSRMGRYNIGGLTVDTYTPRL